MTKEMTIAKAKAKESFDKAHSELMNYINSPTMPYSIMDRSESQIAKIEAMDEECERLWCTFCTTK